MSLQGVIHLSLEAFTLVARVLNVATYRFGDAGSVSFNTRLSLVACDKYSGREAWQPICSLLITKHVLVVAQGSHV